MCVYKCIVEYIPSFIRMQVQIYWTCRTHSILCRNRSQSDCIVCICILLYDKLLCNKRIHRCFDALDYTYFLKHSTPSSTGLQYCNTLQHTATHCNTLQHTATHCITLHHTASHITLQRTKIRHPMGHHNASARRYKAAKTHGIPYLVCCSVLQCVAVLHSVT